MLAHLSVRDFAIVDRLELELRPGMTVLTGETGAGKSILVDALGLTLGDRASARVVRNGSQQAEVIAVFEPAPGSDAARYLTEQDLAGEDGECILRRTVGADGRSRAYINARPTPLQNLRELGDLLVDIHGQHEHQSLLKASVQRRILDEHAGHGELLAEIASIVDAWQSAHAAIEALAGGPEGREQRLDYLRYQVAELATLDVRSDELDALDAEHRRLSHAKDLLDVCTRGLEELDGDADAAIATRLAALTADLGEMSAIDPDAAGIGELLEGAGIQLSEAVAELRQYRDRIDLDPGRLEALEQRLSAVHDAARKHRVEPRELPALHARLREEVDTLESAGTRLAELQGERDALQGRYGKVAAALHEGRVRAAKELEDVLTKSIRGLGMPKGRFRVAVTEEPKARPTRGGFDAVAFQVAVNPGQPLLPLARVASGGELSRISLAIQVIATRDTGVPTLIFDEVDAGIGGRVAEIVGRELRRLATNRQVLCVTHLPQVASLAQQHVQVQKRSRRQETRTDLRNLSGEGRVEEIARMLGGVTITDQTLAHAREMLEQA